jgi:hypothetical protein
MPSKSTPKRKNVPLQIQLQKPLKQPPNQRLQGNQWIKLSNSGSPCGGWEKPIPLALKELPIGQLLQPNQLMVQIDNIDQQGAVQITIRLNAFFVFHGVKFCKKLNANHIKTGKL